MFPQLIAGPIVRYIDVFKEIKERIVTREGFLDGVYKFIRGLGKKVIIANTVGFIADQTFAITPDSLGSLMAWTGILCYSLQIYFDFSGYSDMAIGLGRMFGFHFKENFDHPYIATSIKDFWRRWHISLSTWFRDYLYIPLGGNRKSTGRTYFNLIFVFFITGLWHGASWNFIVWGLFHGVFLLIERNITFKLPKSLKFLNHLYLVFVVVIGWVFFRSPDITYALGFIKTLFSFSSGVDNSPMLYISLYTMIVLLCGIIGSTPIRKTIEQLLRLKTSGFLLACSRNIGYLFLLFYVFMELIQSNFNPFIYFRF